MTMVATMVSWHGDPTLKAKYLARVEAHRLADQLIQGVGFEGGKGCAVGCTFDNYDHSRGPIKIGVPEWLMRLEDVIFEGLPKGAAMLWPTQFLEAIPVGTNLEPVRWRLAILRHKRQLEVLATNPEPYAREVEQALHLTISYCEMMLTAPESAAGSANWASISASISASIDTAESAEKSAANSARSAANSAANSAAYSADADSANSAISAAYSAAGSAHYEWEAETLLLLLRETAITI
jgi:hypothetical protein